MVAIPRRCRDPEKSWRMIESLYLSDAANAAQLRSLGILPASPMLGAQASAIMKSPDAYFVGPPPLCIYSDLAPAIPAQVLTPDTAYATAALGYVLSQTVGAIRDGAVDDVTLQVRIAEWLAARQTDVERQIAHGRLALDGPRP